MKKLILKKEIVSSLSNQSMGRIVGGGRESDQPGNASTAPCRCDTGVTDCSQAACITNALAGCSGDCSIYTCNCGSGSGGGSDDQEHIIDHD